MVPDTSLRMGPGADIITTECCFPRVVVALHIVGLTLATFVVGRPAASND
jgi:hypothetical protein